MTFQAALDSAAYVKLRGDATTSPTYKGTQYMVLCPNTTVFAAQVNGAPSGETYAQVTYDTVTTGAYTDIENGQTVLISRTNDRRKAYFAGFVRKTPTSTILYLNETSRVINDDDYIWVLDDYRIFEKLARKSGSTIYKNYDETFEEIGPIITNLATAYAGIASGTPEVLSISFVATAIAGASGASISSYAWTISTGMTVTAGSASTNTVTIEFDAGVFYWLKLVVTDSNGATATRRIAVASVSSDLSDVVTLGFEGADIEGELDAGWHGSIVAFDGVSTVLDNTFCIIFAVEEHNGTETTIDGSNIKFVGRLRNESDPMQADEAYGFVSEAQFEIEGPGDQISRTLTLPFTFVHDATPTVWDEINNATMWRAMAHLLQAHSTVLTLHSLAFDDTSNNSIFDTWGIDGGDLLSEMQGTAEDWISNVEFAPDGRIEVNQRATQLSSTDRDALTVVANMTNQDYVDLEISRNHVREIGQVDAGGGVYNTNNDKIQEYLSEAPGNAREQAAGVYPMPGQVLTVNSTKTAAETELNTRAGHALEEQNPTDELTVTLVDGWNFLIPTRAAWFTWTLSEADTGIRGLSYTTADRWLLTSISYKHNNDDGALSNLPVATFRLETSGDVGKTIEKPPDSAIDYILPTIPPFPSYPGFPINPDLLTPPGSDFEPPPYWADEPPVGEVEGVKIRSVFFGTGSGATDTGAFTSQQFVHEVAPITIEVTPDTLPSGHYVVHGRLGFGTEAYLLTTDDTESILWYTSNVWSNSPTWVQNDTLIGAFTLIRLGSTQGEVYLYEADSGGQPTDFDATYWLTPEFAFSLSETNTGSISVEKQIQLDAAYPGAVGILIDWSYTNSGAGANNRQVRVSGSGAESQEWDDDTPFVFFIGGTSGSGAHVFLRPAADQSLFTLYTATTDEPVLADLIAQDFLSVYFGGNYGTGATVTFTGTVKLIIAKATTPFPGAGTANKAQTVFSDDYGVTFGSAVVVGDPPDGSFGGMDTIKIGDLVLAASDGQVSSAQSGGAYSAYGSAMPTSAEPAAILIPRATFGTVSGNNAGTTTPEYLVASDIVAPGNEALWKVTASGVTFTDITPYDGSNYGQATGPDCLAMSWRSGKKIAVVMLFGSLPKLYTSDDAGATWTSHGVLTADANAVTFRKGDEDVIELYGTDGQPWFTPDAFSGVATITKRSYPRDPNTDPITWIDVYG